MTLSVDLFYSFRSPFSYLALPKTLKLVEDYDLAVNLRPVYPLAVRVPGFFKKASPNFIRYVVLDSTRVAQHEGIPFRFPRPDPIVQDKVTFDVAAEQPYIHRLTRLGAMAQLEGRSLAFTDAIARVLWDGSVAGWNEGDHLARAADKAGFDLAEMDAAITADPDRYEQGDHGEREGPCRLRPLGRTDLRVRQRAVLRPGPHRFAGLAHGRQGLDSALAHSATRAGLSAAASDHSPTTRSRSQRFWCICSRENPSAKKRSAVSLGWPRIRPSWRTAATASA
ncbi:2-hydroxychromene-2-carboxylate isomerase [Bradyrhizobium sp. F1.13.4]